MRLILIALIFMTSIGNISAQNQPTGITVTGEGIVKVTPDRIQIKARVEHQGQTAKEVKAATDQTMVELFNFLKKQKIAEKDYQTDYINLDKKYDYNTKETHYQATQSLIITLHDLSQYSSIMTGLMNSGINRIDGVSFEDSQLEKHQKEARIKAIAHAREKASDYATTLGLKVGTAQWVSEAGSSQPQPRPMMRSMAFAAGDSASNDSPIAVGQMEIKQQVEIRFAILSE